MPNGPFLYIGTVFFVVLVMIYLTFDPIMTHHVLLPQVEEMPHDFFAFTIIGDFLFSHTPDEFSVFLNQEPRLQQLLKKPTSFWVKMVAQYFVDAPHVMVSHLLPLFFTYSVEHTFSESLRFFCAAHNNFSMNPLFSRHPQDMTKCLG